MAKSESVEVMSANLREDRLSQLRDLFPEAFPDGKLDLQTLRVVLGASEGDRPERYLFTWAGKREAIRLLQLPTRATLTPSPDESIDFDTTQNLFIEGDNLEVLKLLYKPYFGRVKMIYIDPPYNTGHDFIYPDDFTDPLGSYLALTGQQDGEGNLLTSNPETSGRYHSTWLSMMYPRLFLARQLLRDDGVVFITIDDNEMCNLRLVMNEIFGEENFVATFAWQAKDTPGNDSKEIAATHNYVLCFKRSSAFQAALLPRTDEQLALYKNPDSDPRGPWLPVVLIRNEFRPRDYYPLVSPGGDEIWPPKGSSWRFPRETIERFEREGRLWWGKEGKSKPTFVKLKHFLSETKPGVVPTTWWDYRFAGSTRHARAEIKGLFDGERGFDTPKPVQLIKRMLDLATSGQDNDIVLDFFAGSCTTAHAVLEQNRLDGGDRRFIMVQLPESTMQDEFPTIAAIGKERIRRVIARMKAEALGKLDLGGLEDLGFRVFKLAESNFRNWEGVAKSTPEDYAAQMALFSDLLVGEWRADNVIWEVALKEGFSLNARVAAVDGLTQNTVNQVFEPDRSRSFFICLDSQLHPETIKALPLAKDDLFVCRDAALTDAQAANLALQCRLKTL